jgi:hypothetical protein
MAAVAMSFYYPVESDIRLWTQRIMASRYGVLIRIPAHTPPADVDSLFRFFHNKPCFISLALEHFGQWLPGIY